MDDQNAGPEQSSENLISRPPTQADLVALCRELNQLVFLRQWFAERGEQPPKV